MKNDFVSISAKISIIFRIAVLVLAFSAGMIAGVLYNEVVNHGHIHQ